jgi:peptidoglycan hydrolase CwlO-like protein
MQEAIDEIAKRIATLLNQVKHREAQIEEHQSEVQRLTAEIEGLKALADQYTQVLKSLSISVTYR